MEEFCGAYLCLPLLMNLQHLCSASHAEVYLDTYNDWLFIDWEGDLTLDVVQRACLEVARCYFRHGTPTRVLNNNAQVTTITPDVAAWLADEFMSAMHLAGVKQLAWVVAPTLRGRNGALDTVHRLAHTGVHLFQTVEEAVTWLQQTAPLYKSGAIQLT
jgi:hypothetical protein